MQTDFYGTEFASGSYGAETLRRSTRVRQYRLRVSGITNLLLHESLPYRARVSAGVKDQVGVSPVVSAG